MAISKVSFEARTVATEPQQKSSGIIKGTLTTAGLGATVMGGLNYFNQRSIIKNPNKHIDIVKNSTNKTIKAIRKILGNTTEAGEAIIICGKNAFTQMRLIRDFAKEGKVNLKYVGKTAGVAAVAAGGVFLAYRGIKALFTK